MAKRKSDVETLELEGGIKVGISLDKDSGTFIAAYVGHQGNGSRSWRNPDLTKLRDEIRAWHKATFNLSWEAIILAFSGQNEPFFYRNREEEVHDTIHILGSIFIRMFRAKKLGNVRDEIGKWEWRGWPRWRGTGTHLDDDIKWDDPTQEAGKDSHSKQFSPIEEHRGRPKPSILPYTPEKWLALVQMKKMEIMLKERLEGVLGDGDKAIEAMLERVPAHGLLSFGGVAKAGEIGAEIGNEKPSS